MLNSVLEIEKIYNVDITGKAQRGFKRKHSTNTVGLIIQTVMAHALYEDNYAIS